MEDKYSRDAIDWNNPFSYPLQWIYESQFARQMYQQYCYRVNLAMEGRPWKNTYRDEMNSNISEVPEEEQATYKRHCAKLPEGRSFKLYQAVETIANQMSSGVDMYECEVHDPYMIQQGDTADKLAAMCSQDYAQNDLNLFSSLFSRDLTRYGMVAVLTKYNHKLERNEILRINPKNVWFDTMYSATGKERFRGYSTMISWDKLKHMIKESGDEINLDIKAPKSSIYDEKNQIKKATYSNGKIRSLNGLDIYVKDLNRLASNPQLQWGDITWWEYQHDLRNCYNLGYYHSFATSDKAQTKSGYNGMDVELTVMFDLERGIEYKIINRRFVVSMNKKAFKRNIVINVYDPLNDMYRPKINEVHLNCPLQLRFTHLDTMDKYAFPTSPLFHLLDVHDTLCGWRAKREHVAQILSVLRLVTNAADAESLQGVLNIMGVVLDNVEGDVSSLIMNYNWDPIDSQIAHYESVIQDTLSAFTQFDAMQMMGDRASAAESGMAIGAIAQGLSDHQNILMAIYADIARHCILNRVVYSNMSEFPVINRGGDSVLTIQEMALDTIINVKPKFQKKVLERTLAANAMSIASGFSSMLAPEDIAFFIEQAMFGNVPRGLAQRMVGEGPSEQETALAMQQAQNQAQMLQQNQAMYEQNPIPYEAQNTMDNFSSEEVDQIIAGLNTPEGSEEMVQTDVTTPEGQLDMTQLDMANQSGAMEVGLAGQNSDLGSMLANPNGYYG